MSDLPASWRPLGEIAEVVGGVTKDSKRQSDSSFVEVPYLRVANVQRGYLNLETVTTIRVPAAVAAKLRLEPGDILFNEGGDRDKLGRGWIWQGQIKDCIHQNHVFRARLRTEDFDPKFISLHGNGFGRTWFEKMGKQTTNLASLSLTTLKSFPIPGFPVERQRMIVATVEEQISHLDSAIDALSRVRANVGRMRAAVLQAAFSGRLAPHVNDDAGKLLDEIMTDRQDAWRAVTSKPYRQPAEPAGLQVSIPKHWCIASLEALTDPTRPICYGILMPKDHIEDGVPYVRVKDMKEWGIDVPGLRRTSHEIAARYMRASLKTDDLLVAIRGSYGRAAIVPSELDGGNITQDSARIAAHDAMDRRYLLYYLGGTVAQRYYSAVARGVAVKGVNIGDLKALPVPLPPLAEQQAIADEVERNLALIGVAERTTLHAARRADALRASILFAASAGNLLVSDNKNLRGDFGNALDFETNVADMANVRRTNLPEVAVS